MDVVRKITLVAAIGVVAWGTGVAIVETVGMVNYLLNKLDDRQDEE